MNTRSIPARRTLTALAALTLALSACAGSADGDDTETDAAAPGIESDELPTNDGEDAPMSQGMCAEGEPDCDDMIAPGEQDMGEGAASGGASSSCLAGDPDCTDESYDGQDVTRQITIADAPSGADVIERGPTQGASGVLVEQAYLVDDTTLELTFSSGACDTVEDVLVTESDTEVRVLVLAAQAADVEACIQVVTQWSITITLDAPLGDRTLLDLAG